jgi:hypothetical protein
MKRRTFLTMLIPAIATGCVGMGRGIGSPVSTEGVQPEQLATGIQHRTEFDGGENHRSFMKRARDRREAAKKRRDRRDRLARARRRRRNRGD